MNDEVEETSEDREDALAKACADLSRTCRMECDKLGTRWCPAAERKAGGR